MADGRGGVMHSGEITVPVSSETTSRTPAEMWVY